MSWESTGTSLLAASLFRPFALVAAAWLILKLLRVRHPASQHAVWTAVLIGMALLPFVSLISPHWNVPLLRTRHNPPAQAATVQVAPVATEPFEAPATFTETGPASISHPQSFRLPSIETLAIWCYLAGLLFLLAYRAAGWMLLRRVVSRSRVLHTPCLRESAGVMTPVVVGALRPVVILPANWRTWNVTTRRAVLAHEFAHVRRHDPAVSAVARLVQCLLWFHPLAWWVSRKTASLAELACDAAAIRRVADPGQYSRILLEFAQAVNRSGQRVALPGLAMSSGSGMDQRIDQVFALSDGTLRKLSRPGILLAFVGVPVMCFAATVGLGEQTVTPQPVSAVPRAVDPMQTQAQPAALEVPLKKPVAAVQSKSQPAPAPTPKFEVASVKPCSVEDMPRGGRGAASGSSNPERVSVECRTVKDLIQSAYLRYANGVGHSPEDYVGTPMERGPAWIESEHYTIDAKPASPQSQETMRGPMMQALLEDRFRLRIHRDTREVPVYELRVANGGSKLIRSVEGSCRPTDWTKASAPPRDPGDTRKPCGTLIMPNDGVVRMEAQQRTLVEFCKLLRYLGRPVVDKTGIEGVYDFHLVYAQEWTAPALGVSAAGAPPDPMASDVSAAPALPMALQELGLKLEPAKGPREFLVIDHVEHPSGN